MAKPDEKLVVDHATGQTRRLPMTAEEIETRRLTVAESTRAEQVREADDTRRDAVLLKVATAVGVTPDELRQVLRPSRRAR